MSATPPTPQERFDAALAELPAKRQKFVVEYLRDLNGTQAALRAGYAPASATSQASDLLRIPKVAAAVSAGLGLQAMPADEILARLSAIARGSMADFLRVDEEEITIQTVVAVLTPEEEAGIIADATGLLRGLLPDDGKERRAVKISTATMKRAVARLDLLEAGRRGKLGLIKKYSLDPDNGKVAIELYDAPAALAKLGEHHQLWGKAPDLLKHIDLTKLSPEQLERLATGEDPFAVLLGT